MYEGCLIIQGARNEGKLWTIDPPTPTNHSLDLIIDAPTIADRVKFHTGNMFSPTLTTLAKSISARYLISFLSFTTKQLWKYLPKLEAAQMGHLHAKRSGLASTSKPSGKLNETIIPPGTNLTNMSPPDPTPKKCHNRQHRKTQLHHY